VFEIVRPGMEDSESAEKQENTGIGAASAGLLILRSAHAQAVPQTRTRVRASRRMRTSHCVRPHASRRIAARVGRGKHLRLRRRQVGFTRLAPLKRPISSKPEIGCDSMRARGAAHLAKRTQSAFWRNEAKRGVRGVWSARSTNLRLYETTAAALSLFPDCYLQMTFATPTCRLMECARFLQGDTRADVPLKPPSHSNSWSIARRFAGMSRGVCWRACCAAKRTAPAGCKALLRATVACSSIHTRGILRGVCAPAAISLESF
jgi:hypothetical protein